MKNKFTVLFLSLMIIPFSIQDRYSDFPVLKGPYLGQNPPCLKPEVFAAEVFKEETHSTPVFSPDGKEVYWEDSGKQEIVYSKCINNKWTPPKTVSFSSMFFDSDDPSFSYDGRILYFTSYRPKKWYQLFKFKYTEGIWYVERNGEKWSSPKPVGSVINSMKLHWEISITKNSTIYFADNQDIYFSVFSSGEYQMPQKLSDKINTKQFREITPYVDPDERLLIFASTNRPDNIGGINCVYTDLYISFKKPDGTWTKAINMGGNINTAGHNLYPRVSPDGKYLFFMGEDIKWVSMEVIDEFIVK